MKVLLIGWDGVRADALQQAYTPHFDSLIRNGSYSDSCWSVLPSRSGPGWTSILTGVSPAKHGVTDNKLSTWKVKEHPGLTRRLREAGYLGRIASVTHWAPLAQLNWEADYVIDFPSDSSVEVQARQLLSQTENSPDFLFLHFDDADHAGHTFGFHPYMPPYRLALEHLDQRLGRILATLKSRQNYDSEHWLICITSDHGGHYRHHGDDVPEDRRTFLLVQGPGIELGSRLGLAHSEDVLPTIMAFLGIRENALVYFDGIPRGISLERRFANFPVLENSVYKPSVYSESPIFQQAR